MLYNMERVKYFIEVESDSGCTLLSNEYKNVNTVLIIKCKCGEEFKTTFSKFYDRKKRQCNNCRNVNLNINQYKISVDEFQKRLNIKFGNNKFKILEYTLTHEKCKILHTECNNVVESTPLSVLRWKGDGCPVCTNRKKKSHDDFITEVFNEVGDEYEILGNYKTINKKITIKHKACGFIWDVSPSHFLHNKSRCPKCVGVIKKTTKDYKNEVANMVNKEFVVLGEYYNAHINILMRHSSCNKTFEKTPNVFLRSPSCPHCCSRSRGEIKIKGILEKFNLQYKEQYRLPDCKWINPLPFDFAIFKDTTKLFCLIEYDGKQHYESVDWFGGEKALKEIQRRDNIKTLYCRENNIKLIRIPYWDFSILEEILEEELKNIRPILNA